MTKAAVKKKLETLKSTLEELKAGVDEMQEQCQTYHDEKSEKWQEGENGEAYLSMIEEIGTLADELQTAFDSAENIVAGME